MNSTLARFRVIFVIGLAGTLTASAQPRVDMGLVSAPPKPYTEAEAKQHLADFRSAWLLSGLGMSFDFVHFPRHAAETRYAGIGWASSDQDGLVTRFELSKPAADKTAKPEVWEWLLQNGASPHVWVLAPGATAATEVPKDQWRTPMLPGLIYTPFDLMMPFLYWTDYQYNGTDRILGRGVEIYTMLPPPDEKAAGLCPVKLFIDPELGDAGALVRMQQLDAKGGVALQFDLGHVKEVDDQWMFEDCELLNKVTDDYDQFVVKAVALKLTLDPALFQPANLTKPVPMPPESAWHSM